jgi:hypothetical protein
MKKSSAWVAKVINNIPEDISEDHLASLLLTIIEAYMSKNTHGDKIRFLFSLVVTYSQSAGLSPFATKLIFVEAASMIIDAVDGENIPDSPHSMQ